MNKVKIALLQTFTTKIGLLFFSLALFLIFGILANFFSWCETAMYISLIFPVGLTIVQIIFAWIINPINKRKKNK